MRVLAVLGLVAAMSGCGADGEPVPPTRNAEAQVSGSVSFGWVRGASVMGRRF